MYDTYLRGTVIDAVSDEPIQHGAVAIDGNTIAYVGPESGLDIPAGATVYEADTILPGFMDCHAHLVGMEDAGYLREQAPFGDMLLGSVYQAGLLLDAGFTGIRDMSEQGFYLARAQERGIIRAPYIMPGGPCLSITGGHGDIWTYMSKEESNMKNPVGYLCDGPDECLKAVRLLFRSGAKFIKILATGGVSSPMDDVDDIQFSDDELRVIVEEAARHGTYVAAHCTGSSGAYHALQAGVGCIEHGVMLTQREIDMMAERNVPLVTTLHVSLGCAEMDGPEWFKRKARLCAEANLQTIEMARKAGICIALGTDFSNSKGTPYLKNGLEFGAMVRAGMTELEAIRAGTINAARVMKRDSLTGSLEKGKQADIVLVDGDPLEDISCLGDAANVRSVFLAGKKVK
jgi:imidazolonepropionase-like amidohydrolase